MPSDSRDPVYGWEPSIPEPFWVRRWLFWWRPACFDCRIVFRDRLQHDEHRAYWHNHVEDHADVPADDSQDRLDRLRSDVEQGRYPARVDLLDLVRVAQAVRRFHEREALEAVARLLREA